MDDVDGLAARLDAKVQAAVEAYVDPGQDAAAPIHPSQFKSELAPTAGETAP